MAGFGKLRKEIAERATRRLDRPAYLPGDPPRPYPSEDEPEPEAKSKPKAKPKPAPEPEREYAEPEYPTPFVSREAYEETGREARTLDEHRRSAMTAADDQRILEKTMEGLWKKGAARSTEALGSALAVGGAVGGGMAVKRGREIAAESAPYERVLPHTLSKHGPDARERHFSVQAIAEGAGREKGRLVQQGYGGRWEGYPGNPMNEQQRQIQFARDLLADPTLLQEAVTSGAVGGVTAAAFIPAFLLNHLGDKAEPYIYMMDTSNPRPLNPDDFAANQRGIGAGWSPREGKPIDPLQELRDDPELREGLYAARVISTKTYEATEPIER